MDLDLVKLGLQCKCPKCGQGDLFQSGLLTLELRDQCTVCNLDLSKNDSADGPAVFLIFVLGFLLVPLALMLDAWLAPPLWVHVVIWSLLGLAIILGTLKPLKAYVIALQFKYRPGDWK